MDAQVRVFVISSFQKRNSQLNSLPNWQSVDSDTLETNLPAGDRKNARERFQESGLAPTVWCKQNSNTSAMKNKRDASDFTAFRAHSNNESSSTEDDEVFHFKYRRLFIRLLPAEH